MFLGVGNLESYYCIIFTFESNWLVELSPFRLSDRLC